ncbi:8-oxoguanine deaminase [Catellatospora sp. KI3]|uniref:8-oxoguanine deaminase n=1 Tax=Catellatospora sp. KI3 TaxID=3041620 RepID=UPI00248224DE|nr:8-oxoguanine deaminase [Catellatospora sp. KI3]MDI1464596.1 8-oxoguanine deaminase [Catellatospora sp. KI3]
MSGRDEQLTAPPPSPPQRVLLSDCAIATVDAAGTEYERGHVLVEGDRIAAVGAGGYAGPVDRVIDGRGCLATPGLVNTHHHLYQWATRGLAQQRDLFGWLVELYPTWARLDDELVHATSAAGLGWLALSGCTTAADHHYVFPRGTGDLIGAQVHAAAGIGVRLHACRGSMDLGEKDGGLPPDHVVESTDAALAATAEAIERHHDPSPSATVRVAVAPCSPFSVTPELMREAAALARAHGVRLHTHLAETLDEEEFCRDRFGCTPVEYAEKLGWLGGDVWLAHGVHLDAAAIARLGATGTGIAHCPSSNARLGAGIAPVRDLLDAGAPVGLGVDGAASQEAGALGPELRQALLSARLRAARTGSAAGPGSASGAAPASGAAVGERGAVGERAARSRDGVAAAALTAREALALGTIGGARCLGRERELGSLEVGKLADVALWRLDGLGHAGIADPVAALVLGPPAPLEALLVGGAAVVRSGRLTNADQGALARDLARVSRRLTNEVSR